MIRKILADLLRWIALQCNKKLDVAFISTFRDEIDVQKFGYTDPENLPNFFKWANYEWEGLKGSLYMIGSMTEHVAGRSITSKTPSFQRGRRQFIEATNDAVSKGAKFILLAAATKRLFKVGELEEIFPNVVFTLGDNFTGLLLLKMISRAAKTQDLDLRKINVLIIGPYGMLGSVATFALSAMGSTIIGLGNPKRKDLMSGLVKEFGVIPAYSYDEVEKAVDGIDMVIACNSSDPVVLTPDRVKKIIYKDSKRKRQLIVIDPSEPYGMSEENFDGCNGSVIRFDAGNGFNKKLKYIPFLFGNLMWRLLRMNKGVTWGCFCETFLLAKHIKNHPELAEANWFEISRENINLMQEFFGDGEGQFKLPILTNFNRKIVFSEEVEKKIKKMRKQRSMRIISYRSELVN